MANLVSRLGTEGPAAAENHNSSRSNKSQIAARGSGQIGPAAAENHNSSRSNKTSRAPATQDAASAHISDAAKAALAAALGAERETAPARSPQGVSTEVRTAAHEAAHVVQQSTR